MTFPRPGRPVRGSRTGRPIMALLDLLGRRMTLRILWELSRSGVPLTFRALQEAAETNPALLNTRLKDLRIARVVVHEGAGYALSRDSQALLQLLLPLADWADGRQHHSRNLRKRKTMNPASSRHQAATEQERDPMPYINLQITKGATREQKEAIAREFTDVLVRVLSKKPEHTHIVIEEIEDENWGFAGMLTDRFRQREKS